MHDLNDLYFFVKVVEYGGFAPAGRKLGIAKSRLSRRIKLLEERLDVRLIQRSSRSFRVTDVGRLYLEHCLAMLVEAEAAQESVDQLQAEPAGNIKMTCPVGLLHFHAGRILAKFMSQYPRVNIHLEATNRRVDLLNEGVDIALRVRPFPLEDTDLVVRVLSDRGQCLVASPDLVERMNGLPNNPEELKNWPGLSRSTPNELHAWILKDGIGETRKITFNPRYVTTDMYALKEAAMAGVGVVQLPLLMLRHEIEKGTLITLLPDWEPRREVIHFAFPSRRGMLPSIRALIEFFAEQYAIINEG